MTATEIIRQKIKQRVNSLSGQPTQEREIIKTTTKEGNVSYRVKGGRRTWNLITPAREDMFHIGP